MMVLLVKMIRITNLHSSLNPPVMSSIDIGKDPVRICHGTKCGPGLRDRLGVLWKKRVKKKTMTLKIKLTWFLEGTTHDATEPCTFLKMGVDSFCTRLAILVLP